MQHIEKKTKWPKQTAILISNSRNAQMLLRELLRSYGWTVVESTANIDVALSFIRDRRAFLAIVDDEPELPASSHLRHLMTDPVAVCTPVISFTSETHKREVPAMATLGRPELVEKPLTPSKFVPGFIRCIQKWEAPPFIHVRRANYEILASNAPLAMKIFLRLANRGEAGTIAAIALSIYLRDMGKIKEAEKLLMATLKKNPRDLGAILALSDLYISFSMPKLAHRLISSARSNFSNSVMMLPDMVQAALLMGNVDDAISNLYTMQKTSYMEELAASFLSRLLFSEGRYREAEPVMNNNKNAFKKIEAAWLSAEEHSIDAVG